MTTVERDFAAEAYDHTPYNNVVAGLDDRDLRRLRVAMEKRATEIAVEKDKAIKNSLALQDELWGREVVDGVMKDVRDIFRDAHGISDAYSDYLNGPYRDAAMKNAKECLAEAQKGIDRVAVGLGIPDDFLTKRDGAETFGDAKNYVARWRNRLDHPGGSECSNRECITILPREQMHPVQVAPHSFIYLCDECAEKPEIAHHHAETMERVRMGLIGR